jgi:hypothetical protein
MDWFGCGEGEIGCSKILQFLLHPLRYKLFAILVRSLLGQDLAAKYHKVSGELSLFELTFALLRIHEVVLVQI